MVQKNCLNHLKLMQIFCGMIWYLTSQMRNYFSYFLQIKKRSKYLFCYVGKWFNTIYPQQRSPTLVMYFFFFFSSGLFWHFQSSFTIKNHQVFWKWRKNYYQCLLWFENSVGTNPNKMNFELFQTQVCLPKLNFKLFRTLQNIRTSNFFGLK